MITIVPATNPTDFECIAQLADIIWREHYIPIVGKPQIDYMLDKFQSAKAIAQQVDAGFEYFLISFDETSVSYISIKKEESALFLSKIYVLSSYRGHKIAKTAMAFIEEKAKAYHLKAIRLTVNIHNTIAIKAYEALGFKNKGPLVTDIGNGYIMDDYQMEKKMSV
ncbi:GNAT family N-acetyltransferase [Mariniflexile sp.]|uniref:GNAT family N-acetyltransferase n=1 Tax=Mariniflexile sp. TaxID=1979402 RepID=UPI0040487807